MNRKLLIVMKFLKYIGLLIAGLKIFSIVKSSRKFERYNPPPEKVNRDYVEYTPSGQEQNDIHGNFPGSDDGIEGIEDGSA